MKPTLFSFNTSALLLILKSFILLMFYLSQVCTFSRPVNSKLEWSPLPQDLYNILLAGSVWIFAAYSFGKASLLHCGAGVLWQGESEGSALESLQSAVNESCTHRPWERCRSLHCCPWQEKMFIPLSMRSQHLQRGQECNINSISIPGSKMEAESISVSNGIWPPAGIMQGNGSNGGRCVTVCNLIRSRGPMFGLRFQPTRVSSGVGKDPCSLISSSM